MYNDQKKNDLFENLLIDLLATMEKHSVNFEDLNSARGTIDFNIKLISALIIHIFGNFFTALGNQIFKDNVKITQTEFICFIISKIQIEIIEYLGTYNHIDTLISNKEKYNVQ